jgi:hypothetical protein
VLIPRLADWLELLTGFWKLAVRVPGIERQGSQGAQPRCGWGTSSITTSNASIIIDHHMYQRRAQTHKVNNPCLAVVQSFLQLALQLDFMSIPRFHNRSCWLHSSSLSNAIASLPSSQTSHDVQHVKSVASTITSECVGSVTTSTTCFTNTFIHRQYVAILPRQ